MFSGKFERSIDSKNRVVLPPVFKDIIGNTFYITLNFGNDKKIDIRPQNEFESFINKIDENNSLDPDVTLYKRYIMANSLKIETDKLGRFIIPDSFIKSAAIKNNKIIFIGMNKMIELWSYDSFNENMNQFSDKNTIDDLMEKMFKKGIKF